jgi:tetraacyldisaccharide 4'-kinase
MNHWRKILLPFGLIYGLVMEVRNALYSRGFFRSHRFETPVICIGNISTGGTGKTPHLIHYSAILENSGYRVAVLSRGYGRRTKGLRIVDVHDSASDVGDEPLEIAQASESASVVVCEDRVHGIREINRLFSPDVILMDDGLQHRSVIPGFSICLTSFARPFDRDFIFPAGDLREFQHQISRFDALILSKCPETDREPTLSRLRQKAESRGLTFASSSLKYGQLYDFHLKVPVSFPKAGLVITGIAHTEELINYLTSKMRIIEHIAFRDHHSFQKEEINSIFDRYGVENSVITTRKDAVRLAPVWDREKWGELYVLPVEIEMHTNQIDKKILEYVESTQRGK